MKFTKTHEWVEKKEGVYLVGITDHAQRALSDIVFVDLPSIGKEVSVGESLLAIESVKSASDVYAPLAGKVVEVNDRLATEPELVNTSPEADGWLVKMQDNGDFDDSSLLSAEEYQKITAE